MNNHKITGLPFIRQTRFIFFVKKIMNVKSKQLHDYTVKQLRDYTVKQLHSYTITQLNS